MGRNPVCWLDHGHYHRGIDQRATRIAAYLGPNGDAPPSAGGSNDLCPELDEHMLAKVEVVRN